MYTITLLLACLVFSGHGRRVQMTSDQLQGGSPSEDQSDDPLQALAMLLMTPEDAPVGYQVPGLVEGRHSSQPRAPSASMQDSPAAISVKSRILPKARIALDVSMPKDITDDIHMKTLTKMSKSAKVPGFREGKVPPSAIANFFGNTKVKEATVDNMVKVGLQNSEVEKSYHTIGEARLPVTIEKLASGWKVGEPIDFTIEVDYMPIAPVNESLYKGLSVEVPDEPFDQEAYDKALLKLRQDNAIKTPLPAGTVSELGHELKINMNGFYANDDGTKGEPLPSIAGGEGIDLPLEVGQFMPGLVEGVLGVKEGETRQITVTFPRRSKNNELANVKAIFDVECLTVMEKSLPEPGDEFANSMREGMTWEEMDTRIKETVNQNADDKTKEKTQMALQKALVETLPEEFEVPETLMEQTSQERFAEMLSKMRERGESDEKLKETISPENYKIFKKMVAPQVSNAIKGNMAIKAVADQQGLVVSRDKVDDEIINLQAAAVQRKQKFKESEYRPRVEAKLHRDMVFDFLESHATVKKVDAKDEDVEDKMGISPEELAKNLASEVAKS